MRGGIIEWDMTVPKDSHYAFGTVCGITFASASDKIIGGEAPRTIIIASGGLLPANTSGIQSKTALLRGRITQNFPESTAFKV